MHLNRRGFFGLLAGLPLVGRVVVRRTPVADRIERYFANGVQIPPGRYPLERPVTLPKYCWVNGQVSPALLNEDGAVPLP